MQDALPRLWRGHSKRLSTDCLTKTQVPANPNRGSIGAEICPVLVSQVSGLTISQDLKGSGISSSERQL